MSQAGTEKFSKNRNPHQLRNSCTVTQSQEAIWTINGLIETLKDGEKGFQEASEAVSDPHLKSLFEQYSQQRHRFAHELQAQGQSLGELKPKKWIRAAGAMHRAWINLKSTVTSGDDKAILTECERGEDSAMCGFEEALHDRLTSQVREIVSRQFTEITSAHDRVKQLRDVKRKM